MKIKIKYSSLDFCLQLKQELRHFNAVLNYNLTLKHILNILHTHASVSMQKNVDCKFRFLLFFLFVVVAPHIVKAQNNKATVDTKPSKKDHLQTMGHYKPQHTRIYTVDRILQVAFTLLSLAPY
jgi:hypothetical protein